MPNQALHRIGARRGVVKLSIDGGAGWYQRLKAA
jgi:hypothetical protein